MKKEIKYKPCANNGCVNQFKPFKSTDKYCSYQCASENAKPLRKVFISKKTTKEQPESSKKLWDSIKLNPFEQEFYKQRQKIRKKLIKEHGRLVCERCGTDYSILFSVHHIIFRSERPKHPQLNSLKNLIHLCFECHEWFHAKKINRNYLIIKRNLWELFGNIFGIDSDESGTKIKPTEPQ